MRTIYFFAIISGFAIAIGGVWSVFAASKHAADLPQRELGTIEWRRNLDDATIESQRDGKPILILFQEVPGCSTCVGYGQQVLSHPLIQEAIETLFVPVAIFNNAGGADARTLKAFDEPANNNPVVRIVSSNHADLSPRIDGDYTIKGISRAMVTALQKANRDVPTYLQLLSAEAAAQTEKATFAVSCFWSGEAHFGGRDGIIATKPGYLHENEIVDIEFDPTVISFEKLLADAKADGYADHVFARSDAQQHIASQNIGAETERTEELSRPDESPKFYLAQTPLKFLPMTRAQACRVNAAVHAKEDWTRYLSPRQIDLYHAIEKNPDAGWQDATHSAAFTSLWRDAMSKK